MSSDRFDDNQNLPPWLRGVPLPPRPRGMGAPSAPAQPTAAAPTPPAPSAEALPDWLRAAIDEPPTAPSHDLPPWLNDDPERPVAPPAPSSSAAQHDFSGQAGAGHADTPAHDQGALPDWLRDLQSTPSPDAGAESLPPWLSDLAGVSEPAPASQSGALPDWLRDTAGGAQPPASETPAWLDDLVAPPSSTPPAAGAAQGPELPPADRPPEPPGDADDTPDWLHGLVSETTASDTADSSERPHDSERASNAPETDDLPEWLRAAGQASAAPPAVPAAGQSAAPHDEAAGIPDWLRDVSADILDDEITTEPFSFEGATSGGGAPAMSGPPAWLAGATDDDSETLPAWLKDTVSEGQDRPGAAPAAPDVPLWLQDRGEPSVGEPADHAPETVPPPLEEAGAAAASSEEVPGWQPAPAEAPPEEPAPWQQATQPAQASPDELPAWLHAMPPTPPPAEDVPAWLSETPAESAATEADSQPGAQPEPVPSQTPADDDLPAWLQASAPAPAPAPADQDVPPWLRDETGQPLPSAGAPGDANLPEWLRGAPLESSLPDVGPAPAAHPEQDRPAGFDWFEEATAEPVARSAPPADAGGLVSGIELPAWLRPAEPEPPKEISAADARSLDWLTRLGAQEEEESASPVAAPAHRLTPPRPPVRTAAQIEALALLERLAATPFPEVAPISAKAAPGLWQRVGAERLLYLVLLLALVAALVLPAPAWLGLTAPPVASGAEALFAQIDRLTERDIVLIGYEWDARRSGELRPLEQAVMDHLIQRRVKLVLVSTDPQGTLLLFDLRDKLAAAGYQSGGQDYILLGYKPGAELALRALAQSLGGVLQSDFQGNDATLGALATNLATGQPRLTRLGDLSLILVLGDEPSDVQSWMEQVHPSARRPDETSVPFAFLLPAEAAPIVQPYLSQPDIYHLAGTSGALAYQQARGGSGMPVAQIAAEAAQQRLGMLVYIGLFVLGALVVGVAGAAARRRR